MDNKHTKMHFDPKKMTAEEMAKAMNAARAAIRKSKGLPDDPPKK